jgi:hypothetical protein
MELLCRRCHRRVAVSAAEYDIFEQMHYVCFHYEFEHGEFDVDEECDAGGCPSAPFGSGKRAVVETARALAIESASGTPAQPDTARVPRSTRRVDRGLRWALPPSSATERLGSRQ